MDDESEKQSVALYVALVYLRECSMSWRSKLWSATLKVCHKNQLQMHHLKHDVDQCHLWQEIFNRLCELDHKGLSYILEAASLTRLFDSVATLLPHPLQRPLQRQADYHITTTPPGEEQLAWFVCTLLRECLLCVCVFCVCVFVQVCVCVCANVYVWVRFCEQATDVCVGVVYMWISTSNSLQNVCVCVGGRGD